MARGYLGGRPKTNVLNGRKQKLLFLSGDFVTSSDSAISEQTTASIDSYDDASQLSLMTSAIPVILGAILSFVGLTCLTAFSGDESVVDFALGASNGIPDRNVDGTLVHVRERPDFATEVESCLKGLKESGVKETVLWVGNSQLHAINQLQPGEETALLTVHRRLLPKGKYVVGASLNNANLQEHYVVFEFLLPRLNPRTLILPAVFDDMRESGVRGEIDSIFDDPKIVARLDRTELGQTILSTKTKTSSSDEGMDALEETVQQIVEKSLNSSLSRVWRVWEERASLRSIVLIKLYQLRNVVFRIDPTTTRRMIPARYAANRQAFEMILASAKEHNLQVIPYIVPLRNDVTIPYDEKQYLAFQKDMTELAGQYGYQMRDFENVVPPKFWGTKNSTGLSEGQELDFMHFQAGGHQLLADVMERQLLELDKKADQ